MANVGRNDPCPCGSGKKYKRCCLRKEAEEGARARELEDREVALALLNDFIDRFVSTEEVTEAIEEFWTRKPDEFARSEGHQRNSVDAFNGWFWFDRPTSRGSTPAEELIGYPQIAPGVRHYLERMSKSSMQPWEVVDVVPGRTITLRQPLEGVDVTVNEKTGSRTITRGSFLAARVNPHGPSGGPELDCGLLALPMLTASRVLDEITARREEFRRQNPRGDITVLYKELAPMFHDAWLAAFDPVLPDVVNPDGETVLPTTVVFRIDGDGALVASALDAHPELERCEPGRWFWSAPDSRGREMPQGDVALTDDELRLHTLTKEAGERGRALIEALAGGVLSHLHTTHESLQQRVRAEEHDGPPSAPNGLDPAINGALVLEFQERHYRGWLDDAIPALDGATPREAANDKRLLPRLENLIRGLEGMYEEALRDGQPAYDPSWMWAELGLADDDQEIPPQLASERWADEYQWDEELAELAAAIRAEPDFDEKTRLVGRDEVRRHLGARRLLKEIDSDADALAPVLVAAMNHELHRRRTFWVSESLAFMLQKTDTDVVGADLRLPFPSFALVFTDRATLSLGERLIAPIGLPMSGHMLRVLTVFLRGDATESADTKRTVSFDLAFDTLGEGVPDIVQYSLEVHDDAPIFGEPAGEPVVWAGDDGEEHVIERIDPRGSLLRTIVNSILYATSAGVEPVPREPRRSSPSVPGDSDGGGLYYLPGKISISHLRNYEAIERGQGGGQLMHRFMVRGHWRRANPNWKDQRMRWIEPYWKGPDLATIIERQYQLGEA